MPDDVMSGPGDFGENTGFAQPYEDIGSQIVKVLSEDSDTLSGLLKMGALSRQEMEDRIKELEVGLRHGIPQIIMRAMHAVAGSPGRDGHRADQIVAIGQAPPQYFSYAEKKRGGGLMASIGKIFGRREPAPIPPEMRV